MKISNKPMMSDEEIKIIDNLIEAHKPKLCLEWGAGMSTTYFSQHDCIKSWLSIEHDGHYVEYLAPMIADNVQLVWIDSVGYIDSVKLLTNRFDFILIDCKHREECLKIAKAIINPEGIILLHDADSTDYSKLVDKYNGELLSRGEVKVGDSFAHRGLARFSK